MTLLDYINHYYNSITPFQAAISLSILFLYILYLFLRDLDVPPGPRGILLFGYWPFLWANTCHTQLQELGKKYGDVFSFRGTGNLFIHLGSHRAVKEAHVTKSEYFSRFSYYNVLTLIFKDGLPLLNGDPWKVLRKFFILKFKEHGMNAIRENTSSAVYDSLKEIVDEMRKTEGRPIKIVDLATSKCMTVIKRTIFNDEGITHKELDEMIYHYSKVVNVVTSTNFLLMGNFARYCIFPLMPSYWAANRSNKHIESILFNVIEKHKREYDETRVCDLIDCYLKERNDRRKTGDPTAEYFTDSVLVSSLHQFVTDGGLTVGIIVGIVLSTLVERPDEQEKLYQEIIDVIGSNRLPTMEDKTNLPYTNAFIYEVLRYTDFFPLFPGMQCTKETNVCGYKIPVGSVTLVNFYAIHRNPETYENPDEFLPSRFLSNPRPDLPILFGIGKRSCIGEAFSMMQVFLFLTTIVQNFRLTYPEGSKSSKTMFWSEERVEICAFPRSHK